MATSDFTPTTAEVAVHMRARLVDANGKRSDDFTAETEPTKAQIEEAIGKALGRVVSAIGTEICPGDHQAGLYESAKDAVALLAAARAERSYFPEQVGNQRSPYKELYAEFNDAVEALIESVSEHCGGGDSDPGDSVGGAGVLPRSCFPCPKGFAEEEW